METTLAEVTRPQGLEARGKGAGWPGQNLVVAYPAKGRGVLRRKRAKLMLGRLGARGKVETEGPGWAPVKGVQSQGTDTEGEVAGYLPPSHSWFCDEDWIFKAAPSPVSSSENGVGEDSRLRVRTGRAPPSHEGAEGVGLPNPPGEKGPSEAPLQCTGF